MADKAKFAYGSKANIDKAIASGAVDAYDFLCLSGENEKPSVGWIDKNGNPVFVECEKYVEVISEFPETGVEGIIYMLEGKGHVWYDGAFVPMSETIDLSVIEGQISDLETQMDNKVDVNTVETMIKEQVEAGYEIIEF